MPIDIAIVCPGQFAAATDRSSSVERVIDEMSRRLPDRYRATIYSRQLNGTSARERRGSATHQRIRAASRRIYIRRVMRHLKMSKPDIIQVDNRPLLVKKLRLHFPGKPIILSLHSTTFINPRIYGRKALQACFDKADLIAVNSEFLAGWVRQRFKLPLRKLVICRPGVDTGHFFSKYADQGRVQAEKLRAELGYRDKKIILYMGRLVPIKGVHHIMSALPEVLTAHNDAVLVVCGSAKYGTDRISPYVKKLYKLGSAMPHNVRFVPYVPHSQVPAWYQAADVVVMPSARREAFGLVNVEALACGVPVISTRAGGIVEIIRHGVNGMLLDPTRLRKQLADALKLLLADAALRERLGREGVNHVRQHFAWERTAASFAAMYERCAPAYIRT